MPPRTTRIIGAWLTCIAVVTAFHDLSNWISKSLTYEIFELSLILLLVSLFINSCVDRYKSNVNIEKKENKIKKLVIENKRLKENKDGLIEQVDKDKVEILKFQFLFQQQQDFNKLMISYIPPESLYELESRIKLSQLIQKDDNKIE